MNIHLMKKESEINVKLDVWFIETTECVGEKCYINKTDTNRNNVFHSILVN